MESSDVMRHAAACAAQLPSATGSFADDLPRFDREFTDLLDAVRQLDQRFAFDREGRPFALSAVRAALPTTERELFDAVLEDQRCEIAAVQEAMYQLARACARRVE